MEDESNLTEMNTEVIEGCGCLEKTSHSADDVMLQKILINEGDIYVADR